MAGIFGFFDFTKPGKGVDPDDPEKRALFKFLDILWIKKGKLITLNMLYFLCILPIILAFFLFFYEPFFFDAVQGSEVFSGSMILAAFSFILRLPEWVLVVLLITSVFFAGPLTCGFTYILRNFVRREHAWISDLWQRAKMNFKQGVFLGLLDAVMFYIGLFNISLLFSRDETGVPLVLVFGAVFVFFVYLCMRNTLYLMAVTIELSNLNLIRNALIMTFAGLWRHLLIGLICAVFLTLFLFINGLIELVTIPIFGFSLLGLISVFISYPLIDKYLIQPHIEKEEESDG